MAKVEIIDISDNLTDFYEVRIDNVSYGTIYVSSNTIKDCIKQMTKRGYRGDFDEHFAEICAKYSAFNKALGGYFHYYNSTGYAIDRKEYPEEYFYEVQKAVYDFVLPMFKKAVSEMKA